MRRCLRAADFFQAVRSLKAARPASGKGWAFVCPVCQADEMEIPRGILDTFSPAFTSLTCSHGCEPDDIAQSAGLRLVLRADEEMSAQELWDELPDPGQVERTRVDGTLRALLAAVAKEPTLDREAWVSKIAAEWKLPKAAVRSRVTQESQPAFSAPKVRPIGPGEPSEMAAALPDLELGYEGRIPRGWDLRPSGVYRSTRNPSVTQMTETAPDEEGFSRDARVLPAPVVISALLRDYETGTIRWSLMWRSHLGWRSVQPMGQEELSQARTVTKLAAFGVPVTSNTAKDVVDWLTAYHDWNKRVLPQKCSTDRLGWVADGFLLGHTWVGDGEPVEPQPGGALEQLAAAFEPAGTEAAERSALAECAAYPAVLALQGVALSTVLLEPLSAEPFSVIVSGRSGLGKTRSVTCALSVWGASGHGDKTMRRSWNATSNSITALVTLCRGIPVFLDELQQVRDEGLAKRVIYDMASGQGRGRSDRTGAARALPTSKTVIVTTGEHTVMAEARERGMHARALELTCAPWGGESEELGVTVDRLARELEANHGHTGLAWVRLVVEHLADRVEWRALLDGMAQTISAEVRRYAPKADKAMGLRVAKHIALIRLTLEIAAQYEVLVTTSGQREAAVWVLVSEAVRSLNECDPAITALRVVVDAALAQRGLLFEPLESDKKEGRDGGWVGRLDNEYLAISASWLREVFKRNELGKTESALQQWRALGILAPGESDNLLKKFRLGIGTTSPTTRLVGLRLAKVGEYTGAWLNGREPESHSATEPPKRSEQDPDGWLL